MASVKVKSYSELKNKSWFVDDMKFACGITTEISFEIDDEYVYLKGCGDWQFGKDGLEE